MNKQSVLITGVSSGIGLATAQHLLSEGYRVWGSVRRSVDAHSLVEKWPDTFTPLICDVTNDEDIQQAVDHLRDHALFAIINNAGFAVSGPLEHVDLSQFEQQLRVNVTGVLRITQAFLPHLKRYEGSLRPRIINIGSVSGFLATPFSGTYATSKHALEGLSDVLRRELLLYNIPVVLLQPGPVDTPIWDKVLQESSGAFMDTAYAPMLQNIEHRIERNKRNSLSVNAIAALIDKVLQEKVPKHRYLIDKRPMRVRLFRALPSRFIDQMVLRFFKRKYKQSKTPWPSTSGSVSNRR